MNLTIPIILIVISVGTFFTWIDPQYKEIQELNKTKKEYQKKEAQAEEIRQARNKLNRQYAAIGPASLTRLEKLLPNHMDNVELIVDIDRIAKKDNVRIGDISLVQNQKKKGKKNVIVVEESSDYESVNLSFSFITTYQNFKYFLGNLRKSLRLVDIVSVDFTKNEDKNDLVKTQQVSGDLVNSDSMVVVNDNYKFNIVLRTYWLKK